MADGCGKQTFMHKGDADRHARVVMSNKRHEKKSGFLRPYRCPICRLFHLTSEKDTTA